MFDIKVDRHYFDHEGDNGYLAFFSIEEKTYELWVHFDGKHITNIMLSEWLDSGSFEDGDDADNIYREDILYYIAMSSYNYAHLSVESKQRERYLTFVDDYYNFIGEVTDSPYRKELDVLYKRAQKALGRYSGTEEDLEAREKDFEKERKKLLKQSEENGK